MTITMNPKKPKTQKSPKLFPDELIEQLLAQVEHKDAESILGESGLAGLFKKQLAERMLAAELNHHLASKTERSKASPAITETAPVPKPLLRPTTRWNWIFRATGEPRSSRNWSPSISGGCRALMIMSSACTPEA